VEQIKWIYWLSKKSNMAPKMEVQLHWWIFRPVFVG
jgi:hypothetical protein